MKALIWKEWRENLKWVPLPGLVILLVFYIAKPEEPIPYVRDAYYFCLIAIAFGAALGFVQVFFESQGDKRSVLLHRPLGPSRIFLAKALSGAGLYVLALGIPFACFQVWLATPGNMAAPYHWRTSLPWLADILSGLVYYFAGMLTAQRTVRWYGSRGLGLAAAFCCSNLVWSVPEFWQALLAIGIIGGVVGVAAWGSFCAGGAYVPQPRLAKAALTMTFLLGLLILSVFGKEMIGDWFHPMMHYQVNLTRQGRVLFSYDKEGSGEIAVTDLDGQALDRLKVRLEGGADHIIIEAPSRWGYRHNSRFYSGISNDSTPGNERWYYDHAQGRLFGYDKYYHHLLGSFGPEGFTPAGRQPAERFQQKLRYYTNRWQFMQSDYLVFPGRVYSVDFAQRTLRTLFTPSAGEKVTGTSRWRERVVVSTDKAFHVLTQEGAPVVSLPRVFDSEKYGFPFVGRFKDPERYFVWYHLSLWVREPEEYQTAPSHLLEYDEAGRELAHRTVPPFPYPAASYAEALFGLATPMTEAALLVGASRYVRWEERSQGSIWKSCVLDYLDNMQYCIPGTSTMTTTYSPAERAPGELIAGYLALMLLSAAAGAIGCLLLARRSAFARGRSIGWAILGFLFGWLGLALMLAVQEWPARIACPKCRRLRVVTRDACEHCGAPHALPGPDGTEIFASAAAVPDAAGAANY